MRRIVRQRRLTPEEAENYQSIREQVAAEMPDLIHRHHERCGKTKSVEWSYPTSGNAVRFRFRDTGCWTVETMTKGAALPVAVAAFLDKGEAISFARRSLPDVPWSRYYLQFNPDPEKD
jgi:hypothetical protein